MRPSKMPSLLAFLVVLLMACAAPAQPHQHGKPGAAPEAFTATPAQSAVRF